MEVEEPAAAIGLEPPPPSNFKAEQESLEAQSEFLGVGQELGKRPSSDDIPVAISLNELQGSDGDEILHGAVIDWIKSRISLPGYHAEEHWMSKHDEVSLRVRYLAIFCRVNLSFLTQSWGCWANVYQGCGQFRQ
jgi:hypothetical protein